MSLNPLGGVQFRLIGGWRSALLFAIAYLAAAGFVSGLIYSRVPPEEHARVHPVLWSLTAVLQLVLLLMLGPATIRRSVQRDFQTGMMESHRLTPLSGLRIALGYLTGPPAPLFVLASVGLLIGCGYAAAHGRSIGFPGAMLGAWMYGHLCLAFLAAMIYSLSLLSALATAGKGQFIGIFVAMGVVGGGFLVFAVPGLALVLGVMSIGIFTQFAGLFGTPAAVDGSVTGWSALSQVLFTIVFLDAAARKIRAPERAIFNLPQGLIFCALSWLTLVVGFQKLGVLRVFGVTPGDQSAFQCAASLATFQLASIVLSLAAADHRLHSDRTAALLGRAGGGGLRIVDAVPVIVALAGVALTVLMPNAELELALRTRGPAVLSLIFAACLLNCVMDYAWLYLALSRRWRVLIALAIPVVIFKALPFVAEGILQAAADESPDLERLTPWIVAALSPLGLPTAAISGAPVAAGVICQVAVTIASVVVARIGSGARPSARSVQEDVVRT